MSNNGRSLVYFPGEDAARDSAMQAIGHELEARYEVSQEVPAEMLMLAMRIDAKQRSRN